MVRRILQKGSGEVWGFGFYFFQMLHGDISALPDDVFVAYSEPQDGCLPVCAGFQP